MNVCWIDRVALGVIGFAADHTPPALRARLREEWLADLPDMRGGWARVRHALGCCQAAMQIGEDCVPEGCAVASAALGPQPLLAIPGHREPLFAQPVASDAEACALCEINTTPLIDILLVLLVTLIGSLPLMTHSVRIALPQLGAHATAVPRPVIDLVIDFDGTLEWNGVPVAGLPQLQDDFRAASHQSPQPEIHLRPNRHVRYDTVAQVLAAAQRDGVRNLSFYNMGEFGD